MTTPTPTAPPNKHLHTANHFSPLLTVIVTLIVAVPATIFAWQTYNAQARTSLPNVFIAEHRLASSGRVGIVSVELRNTGAPIRIDNVSILCRYTKPATDRTPEKSSRLYFPTHSTLGQLVPNEPMRLTVNLDFSKAIDADELIPVDCVTSLGTISNAELVVQFFDKTEKREDSLAAMTYVELAIAKLKTETSP